MSMAVRGAGPRGCAGAGEGSARGAMRGSSPRPGLLRFPFARSGGPQAQWPLKAGAPPGWL